MKNIIKEKIKELEERIESNNKEIKRNFSRIEGVMHDWREKDINDIECEEEYEEYYYLLTDIQDNLDLEEIEIKDIYDYMDTLNRQMKTVKEMISKL